MSNQELSLDRLEAIYEQHPCRLENILGRVMRQRGGLEGLTALDLAVDPEGEITDQNHVGGVRFVRELAAAAEVSSGALVVDIGCGLGGSARVLAMETGCRVIGVEKATVRAREATVLTELVGLTHRVRIVCGDALGLESSADQIDVLWGQSAWVHIADKIGFLRRWVPRLRRGGIIACEDVYLARPSETAQERELLRHLSHVWGARFVSREQWRRSLAKVGCHPRLEVDRTKDFDEDFARLLDISRRWVPGSATDEEIGAWQAGRRAAERGLLEYVRSVSVRK